MKVLILSKCKASVIETTSEKLSQFQLSQSYAGLSPSSVTVFLNMTEFTSLRLCITCKKRGEQEDPPCSSNVYFQTDLCHWPLFPLNHKDLFLNSQCGCLSSMNKTPKKTKDIFQFGFYSVKCNVFSEYETVKQDAFPLTGCVGMTSGKTSHVLIHLKRLLQRSNKDSVRLQSEIQTEPHASTRSVQPVDLASNCLTWKIHIANPMVLDKMLKCLPRTFDWQVDG